jgi:hypothetical protein
VKMLQRCDGFDFLFLVSSGFAMRQEQSAMKVRLCHEGNGTTATRKVGYVAHAFQASGT